MLGKKTDLKYKASPEGIVSLVKLQRKILSCAASYVKPGGELLYSTCTVNPKENIENVHWFLKEFPEFYADDIREDLCLELRESVTENGCIQLLPGVIKADGFFCDDAEKEVMKMRTTEKDEMAGRRKRVKWQDTKNEKGKYENEERYSGI